MHNVDNEDNIAVQFPLECVCPSTLGEQQEEIADHTLYKLFGTVQHQTNENDGGHCTAITNKSTGNLWHVYNNSDMRICKFQNRKQNKTLLGFQKSVSILFYKCCSSQRCIINKSNMVDTTRRLNNSNVEPTNPNAERIIEHSPHILNAHANTMIFDSPHNQP